MDRSRRDALRQSGSLTVLVLALGAGLVRPGQVHAATGWNKAAFDAKDMNAVARAMGAAGDAPRESREILMTGPEIAENGAVVPIVVQSRLAGTEEIAILIEKNPNLLAAIFTLGENCEPNISSRVKMGQTSDVYALVRAGGKYYYTKREIKVTLGGCGG